MNNTEDEGGIETSLDMNWIALLETKASDANFTYINRKATIQRVPHILKKVDNEAYVPLIVSLGPYHRDEPHLQTMKPFKWRCLHIVLGQNPAMVMKDYVGLIRKLESRAREAYSDVENVREMDSNSFVEMMLMDGCFLMLTIMGISEGNPFWTEYFVKRDIFILENQLPFFLLEILYKSAFPHHPSFRKRAFQFICENLIRDSSNLKLPSDSETFHHLIHFYLSFIDPTTNHNNGNVNQSSTSGFLCNSKLIKSLPSKLRSCLPSQVNKICCTVRDATSEENIHDSDLPWIPCATVLNEAGIHFEKKQRAKSFLDITFHNGKLEIPELPVVEITNPFLRNLIAYEQFSTDSTLHVTSYMMLMDSLINTTADVDLLQQHEIIIGYLGDSQEIATLFNKLGTNVIYSSNDFYLKDVCTALKKHHDTRCNKWRARLNRDYFSNPWAAISLVGALTLFVLTAAQTTFAVLSYVQSSN